MGFSFHISVQEKGLHVQNLSRIEEVTCFTLPLPASVSQIYINVMAVEGLYSETESVDNKTCVLCFVA